MFEELEPHINTLRIRDDNGIHVCIIDAIDGTPIEASSNVSRLDASNNAFKKLQEHIHAQKLKQTHDKVYHFIDTNTFTYGDLKSKATMVFGSGPYNDDMMTQHCEMFIPVMMLGRQTGHTTAIKTFLVENPSVKVGIVCNNTASYDHSFRNHKNAFRISKEFHNVSQDNRDSKLRGVRLDYIIFDSPKYSMDSRAIMNVMYSITPNTRIVGVGT